MSNRYNKYSLNQGYATHTRQGPSFGRSFSYMFAGFIVGINGIFSFLSNKK